MVEERREVEKKWIVQSLDQTLNEALIGLTLSKWMFVKSLFGIHASKVVVLSPEMLNSSAWSLGVAFDEVLVGLHTAYEEAVVHSTEMTVVRNSEQFQLEMWLEPVCNCSQSFSVKKVTILPTDNCDYSSVVTISLAASLQTRSALRRGLGNWPQLTTYL